MVQTMTVSAELMAAMNGAVKSVKSLLQQGKRRTSADFVCEVLEDIAIEGETPVRGLHPELQAALRLAKMERDLWRPTPDNTSDLSYSLEELLKLLERVA